MAAEAGIGRLLTEDERGGWPGGPLRSAFVLSAGWAMTAWHCVRDVGGTEARLWLRLQPRHDAEYFVDVPVQYSDHDQHLDAALLSIGAAEDLGQFLTSVALPLGREVNPHDPVRVGGFPQRNPAVTPQLFGGTVESADALVGRRPAIRVHVRAFAARYAEWPDGMSGGPLLRHLPSLGEQVVGVVSAYPRSRDGQGASGGSVLCRRIADLCDRFPVVDQLANPPQPNELPRFPLAALYGVPRTTPRFQSRPEIETLAQLLLGTQAPREGRNLDDQIVAVAGLAGCGKTVLAAAVARLVSVRSAFTEICWINAGPEFSRDDAVERAATLRDRFVGDAAVLVVLDDVWNLEPIEPFLDALGPQSRVLLTTRHAWIASRIGARTVTASPFTTEIGLGFLAAWVGRDARELPVAARSLVQQCAGLPLALAMAGALAHDGVRWEDIVAKIDEARLEFVAAPLLNYPHPSLAATLTVSVRGIEEQSPQAAALLRQISTFQADSPVPAMLVESAAAANLGLTPPDTRKALAFLATRSLVILGSADVALHNLVLAFVRGGIADKEGAQRNLVSAFATLCAPDSAGRPDWCRLPADGYLWQHLTHHLLSAGQIDAVAQLLGDSNWPHQQVTNSGIAAAIADLDRYVAAAQPPDPDIALLGRVLKASAHILRHDPRQYQLQLAMRIGGDPRVAERFGAAIAALPAGVPRPVNPGSYVADDVWMIAQSAERLDDVSSGLVAVSSPGPICVTGDRAGRVVAVDHRTGQVRFTIKAHEDRVRAIASWPERSLLATGSGEWLGHHLDCSIRLWDLNTGDAIATLSECLYSQDKAQDAHTEPIGDLLFADSGQTLVSASWDGTVGIWDTTNGRRTHTLSGHDEGLNTAGLTSDGRYVVSGTADGKIGIWELPSGELRLILDPEAGPPARIRGLPDASRVACLTYEGNLLVIDIPSGQVVQRHAIPGACGFLVMEPAVVRVARSNGGLVDLDICQGTLTNVGMFPEEIESVHFCEDPRWVAASRDSRTAHYDLKSAQPRGTGDDIDKTTVSVLPAEDPEVALLVRRNGTVLTLSVPDATELGRQPSTGPVLGVQPIPGGLIARAEDRLVWWTAQRRKPRIVRQVPTLRGATQPTVVGSELGITWESGAWAYANIWRLDAEVIWHGLVGTPRELHPFLPPQDLEYVSGSYRTTAAVDYKANRFVIAHSGLDGVCFVDRDGQPLLRLQKEPYYRDRAVANALLPESPFYVEASQAGITVWNLDSGERTANSPLPEDTADVAIHTRGAAIWTIQRSGQVCQFNLPALRETYRARLPLIGTEPKLLPAYAAHRIAIADEHLNHYFVDADRSVPTGPVGLGSPAVGCIFSPSGQHVLVAQRNGDVLVLDLHP